MDLHSLRDLHVQAAGYQVHRDGGIWDRGGPLPDFDLILVIAGSARFEWESDAVELHGGDCIICRKGHHYVQHMDASVPLTEIYIHFDWGCEEQSRLAARTLPHMVFNLAEAELIRTLALRAVESQHLPGGRELAAAWVRVLLIEILRQAPTSRCAGPARDREQAIRRVTQSILENVTHPWRIDELARMAVMSSDHFRRLFRLLNGIPAGEFVVRARIEAAKRLLRDSSCSVTEIADQLGFCDPAAFSRLFKTRTGTSPLAFRRRCFPAGARRSEDSIEPRRRASNTIGVNPHP